MTELLQILPCPWCGVVRRQDVETPIAIESAMKRWRVVCLVCRSHGPECKTERLASLAWNSPLHAGGRKVSGD